MISLLSLRSLNDIEKLPSNSLIKFKNQFSEGRFSFLILKSNFSKKSREAHFCFKNIIILGFF